MDAWLVWGAVGVPLFLTALTIAALRFNRVRDRERASNAWRDTSLDDWRKERQAQARVERQEGGDAAPAAAPAAAPTPPRTRAAPRKRKHRE